ncbi:MAG: alpha-glucan family phosphorylase [Bacteroidales bacterium]|jgi:phosphorylase/glycogen(starch) synthase|nr:alpha-glucan family phosphorylase [Bacteroidales bacterium]
MNKKPDYIFETSWEICNKVGGIYTVISTKALTVVNNFKDNYICIGPDLSKENNEHSDFIEDPALFKNWRISAQRDGLRIRIGRWKINGNPIAVLVDFTPFFEKKNEIFTKFWLQYHLDSLSGQWDYTEPALFGFAAGKVIESFYNYYCGADDQIIAHFHEWMTGTGGLYLNHKVPQIATVFTTHATVLGRCIAGNELPLYKDMELYNPMEMANRFNVMSKHSLESLTALYSDAFTTVSTITDTECVNFLKKSADVVTINGFENGFVPKGEDYHKIRAEARKRLITVTEALIQQEVADDTLLIINSGRYEYKNKGIDLFIEGLAKLRDQQPEREIVAFIIVPAGTGGQREDLHLRMNSSLESPARLNDWTTHPLLDQQNDPIINGFKKYNLNNSPESKVKVIFAPVYLNGHDGVFNMPYYDLLTGFDLSIFPSYYEPWGYTPLESAAFGIPTVTTSLAGFGKWVQDNFQQGKSVWVIERGDDNDSYVSDQIAKSINYYLSINENEKIKHNQEATEISQHALWENLFDNYLEAYSGALYKSSQRYDLFKNKTSQIGISIPQVERPVQKWKKITVKSNLPDPLNKLMTLAKNIWWSWNYEAWELFEEIIGAEIWKEHAENPVRLLQILPIERIELFANNQEYIAKLEKVHTDFVNYMQTPKTRHEKKIAYFSMEYGLSNELKIFSGGLGMLAGDYLKEASDSHVDMIGVGLLYRYGYFSQQISPTGDQLNLYPRQSFSNLPICPVKDDDGNWIKTKIALPGRTLYARIWRVDVGRIPLYLMDTDFSDNRDEDRSTTATLYGGDNENRLKQEVLLGIGGIRMLKLLGIEPELYHLNEGHAAFISLERLRNYVQEQHLPMPVAKELVRASSLYTTHTPVPAGHDTFSEDLMRKYFSNYPERFNISWEEFMAFGRGDLHSVHENFSMSVLACHFSQEVNGVSRIHGRISREMFNYLYPDFLPEELHIGYVTNGVHFPTWAHKKWQAYLQELFGEKNNIEEKISDPEMWKKIYDAKDEDLWGIKNELRRELMEEVKALLETQLKRRNESPSFIVKTLKSIRNDVLTIGFARRFATYKRAQLLFSNEERLNKLVNNSERPITFLFAGKAHPHDKAGQDLIKRIIEFSRKPEFIGKIIFLENYDMILAKKLVSGCDVWLNTPTRPLEASGTSGEKAVMNGVLNFSVMDGWWAEGYTEGAGWAIDEEVTYQDNHLQDELDAATLYYVIDEQIAPAFYHRDILDTPTTWTQMMRENFYKISPHFTMQRQLNDYYDKFYHKLEERSTILKGNNLEQAFRLVKWKNKLLAAWDNIEIVQLNCPDTVQMPHLLGETLHFEVKVNLGNIQPNDIRIELLIADKENDRSKLQVKSPFTFTGTENTTSIFHCEVDIKYVGAWSWAIRLLPYNPLLPHDMDMNLVKWI